MTDLDDELRRALRPIEPPDGFTAQVMARVAAKQQSARWHLPLGLAAALLLSLSVYVRVHRQHQQLAGFEARRQVIEALRLTDQKLNLAFQMVRETSGT